MAIDVLQDKIRKLKNPAVVDFTVLPEHIPEHLRENTGYLTAYNTFCRELLVAMKDAIPAVRFSMGAFTLFGPEGLSELQSLLRLSRELDYYVFLDMPDLHSSWAAKNAAEAICRIDSVYPCNAVIISPYLGTDVIKPFAAACKNANMELFPLVRSANKSAPELQDLMTGGRLVNNAAADLVNRFGNDSVGKYGYSGVGMVVAATNQDNLRTVRAKYQKTFLLADGLDYPGGNAKNCALAFDRMGHGATVCAGGSITGAWKEAQTDGRDYVEQAMRQIQRVQNNITRYTTIL